MGKKEQGSSPLPDELVKELAATGKAALAEMCGADDAVKLEQARVAHLGMKGTVAKLFERIPKLAPEQRRSFGQQANALKTELERALEERTKSLELQALDRELAGQTLDVTLPGRRSHLGRRHPVSRTMDDLTSIFRRLGFELATGPEIETEYYNFEALNLLGDHPARDEQATFWVDGRVLGSREPLVLRTQTSPVQVRTMLSRKPPVRIIAPGRVYRCDSDVSHTPMFHQIEGLLVDRQVSFAELKGTLGAFVRAFFGTETRTRFRAGYFPFTEPSAEMDISCVLCGGKGCRVCKQSGWIEVLGSGMVHPNVFKAVGYDPDQVSGFAFGMGIDRLALLRYGIDDLRSVFENDPRFLEQFSL